LADSVVVDASALLDLLLGSELAQSVEDRLRDHDLHAPAHFDAEMISALERLHRMGRLTHEETAERVKDLSVAPIERHPLGPLLEGAWQQQADLGAADALYVELAHKLDAPVVTTDQRLAAASQTAELVTR
jgi:predicted nucleic acid-binding protein